MLLSLNLITSLNGRAGRRDSPGSEACHSWLLCLVNSRPATFLVRHSNYKANITNLRVSEGKGWSKLKSTSLSQLSAELNFYHNPLCIFEFSLQIWTWICIWMWIQIEIQTRSQIQIEIQTKLQIKNQMWTWSDSHESRFKWECKFYEAGSRLHLKHCSNCSSLLSHHCTLRITAHNSQMQYSKSVICLPWQHLDGCRPSVDCPCTFDKGIQLQKNR